MIITIKTELHKTTLIILTKNLLWLKEPINKKQRFKQKIQTNGNFNIIKRIIFPSKKSYRGEK